MCDINIPAVFLCCASGVEKELQSIARVSTAVLWAVRYGLPLPELGTRGK